MKRATAIAIALVLTLSLAACTDSNLSTVAKALEDVAAGMKAVQTTVINARAQNLISIEDALKISQLCLKVDEAELKAIQITRGISKLDPAHQHDLSAIFTPIVQAVNDALSTGLIGVKDPNTKLTIQASLTAVQGALAIAQAVLTPKGAQ